MDLAGHAGGYARFGLDTLELNVRSDEHDERAHHVVMPMVRGSPFSYDRELAQHARHVVLYGVAVDGVW